jgi:Golgi phosphoprotein 3
MLPEKKMKSKSNLYLHEEIGLLALKDEEGTFYSSTNYHFGMGGAILAELLLLKRVAVEQVKKAKFLVVTDDKIIGDVLLDECLQMVINAKRRTRIENWVSKFANLKQLKHRIAQQLCNKGILSEDKDKVLLLFKRRIYPELNPIPEEKIVGRLRSAIQGFDSKVDAKTVILISIAKSTDLLKTFMSRSELRENKERIKQLINGELTGKATAEAIEAMQAAVIVATIIPAVVATTVTTS